MKTTIERRVRTAGDRAGHDHSEASRDERISKAIGEFLAASEAGNADRSALLAKYNDVAGELAGCLEALDFMNAVAPQLGHSPSESKIQGAAAISPLATLGDFRILREIGRGGMGVVYEAEQLSIGRRVALKVLPFAAMLDRQQLNRFKNEARAAGTLDHPNIVAIYSVGVERSVHYYAMQLIEGQSLAEVIAAQRQENSRSVEQQCSRGAVGKGQSELTTALPLFRSAALPQSDTIAAASLSTLNSPPSTLPPFSSREYYRAIAHLGIQAAEALDHAHNSGILHRDIKPANLLVECSHLAPRDGTSGNMHPAERDAYTHLKLWITDFGLARIEQDAGMTMTGDLLGTLRYMSPEQALGKRVVVDHRSDIYSLGVTLYELLTLQPAYSGDDRHELLRQIAFEEPGKPRQINPRIPQDLETIILKATEKNPADRYATAQELADDLRRFSEDRAIHARRPRFTQYLARFARRHRAATAMSLITVFLISITVTAAVADRRRLVQEARFSVQTSLGSARQSLKENDVNQAALRLAEAQQRIDAADLRDDGLVDDVARMRFEVDRYRRFRMLADWTRGLMTGSEAAIEPVDEALALYKVVEEPNWLQSFKSLNSEKEHSKRVTETIYELLLLKADHLTRWSDQWPEATRQARLEAQSHEAITCLERAIAFHKPSRGYYWLLANCWLNLGDRDKEKQLRTMALETAPHHAAELFYINRDRVWGTDSPGRDYRGKDFEQSYREHREMLRLDPTYFNAMYFMAIRLEEQRRYAEALIGWYGCFSINPNEWAAVLHRGLAHSRLGQFDEAKADFDAVIKACSDDPTALKDIAFILATEPSAEIRNGGRAIQLAEKGCTLTDYKDPGMLDALACGFAEVGNFESAVKWSEMAVKLCDTWRLAKYQEHLDSFRQDKPWREK